MILRQYDLRFERLILATGLLEKMRRALHQDMNTRSRGRSFNPEALTLLHRRSIDLLHVSKHAQYDYT